MAQGKANSIEQAVALDFLPAKWGCSFPSSVLCRLGAVTGALGMLPALASLFDQWQERPWDHPKQLVMTAEAGTYQLRRLFAAQSLLG